MALREGELVDGRYRIQSRIGSGGMADVWLADDIELDRQVALKVLHDNFTRDREFVERFRREASAAAALQHANVVGVYDRGQVDDTYYIAMEYVDGSSLRELMERGLTVEESVEVTRQLLTAAEFAHSRGIVHRDLKPMNALIDGEGRIRVTDFGIARAADSADITRTGSVMGTAQYLSPEQAQGQPVTAASDVYAVGVMLFEMLTGQVPFDGDNAVAIAMKQVAEPAPPPSSINPLVPPALDSVVLRALAKDPANRYASAEAMIRALDEAEANPHIAGHTERHAAYVPPEERDRRRWLWAAAILALLLALGALAFLLTRGDQVRVPAVTDLNETQATIRLQNAGFEVDVNRIARPEPEGTVVEQNPPAGTEADEGSAVTLDVSLGPAPAEVPDVTGEGRRRARNQLERAGFEVEFDSRSSDAIERGRVIETRPAADTLLAAGETVVVLISAGSEEIVVPGVVGQNRIQAKAQLEDLGLLVSQTARNADQPEDEVIEQVPGAGEVLEEGDRVTLVYSTGAGSIVLDDYVGQSESFARRRLQSAGLSVRVRRDETEDRSDDGVVLAQAPSSGTRLSPGDRVTITVGRYREPPEPDPPDEEGAE